MSFPTLNNQLDNASEQFRDNFSKVPHIVIGNKQTNPNVPYKKIILPEEDNYEKIRRTAFWVICAIVFGYAGYRLILALFF
jgi:hypothetical protein